MGGILSPDGESVLHESKWVEAILSPDESMYYYEGEWYSLNEEITSAIPVVLNHHRSDRNTKLKTFVEMMAMPLLEKYWLQLPDCFFYG